MKFIPKTNEEIEQGRPGKILLEPGTYDFEVLKAEDKTSKSGNDMIELMLKVYGRRGETIIFDYLVATDKMTWKIKHFCESTGLAEKYEQGSLTSYNCIGKSGRADIVVQHDDNNVYPDKNGIRDYIPEEQCVLEKVKSEIIDFDLDKIPF